MEMTSGRGVLVSTMEWPEHSWDLLIQQTHLHVPSEPRLHMEHKATFIYSHIKHEVLGPRSQGSG